MEKLSLVICLFVLVQCRVSLTIPTSGLVRTPFLCAIWLPKLLNHFFSVGYSKEVDLRSSPDSGKQARIRKLILEEFRVQLKEIRANLVNLECILNYYKARQSSSDEALSDFGFDLDNNFKLDKRSYNNKDKLMYTSFMDKVLNSG